jgi:ketosteroid isomerase-like protein
MKKFFRWSVPAMILQLGCSSSHAQAGGAQAVRQARAAFNDAIARRDATAMVAFLLPTYHIVTGRSAQKHGVPENLQTWTEMFRADATVTYVRTPVDVEVNEDWGLAHESGRWKGTLTASDGPVVVSGVYAAKWQRTTGGQWLLQSEIFTTLACKGGPKGCVPPDPV